MAEKIRVLLVEPLQKPKLVEIDHTLKAQQEIVGGTVQAVYPWEDPVAILADDDGKLKGYYPNRVLEDEDGKPYDILVGPFLIVGLSEDDFTSLPEELARKYEEKFHWEELFTRSWDGHILCQRMKPGESPRVVF